MSEHAERQIRLYEGSLDNARDVILALRGERDALRAALDDLLRFVSNTKDAAEWTVFTTPDEVVEAVRVMAELRRAA